MKIELDNLRVMIGIPGGRPAEWDTALSLAETAVACYTHSVPCTMKVVKNCPVVTKARDEIVADFLQSDCNRLFWIDSDIEWTAAQFLRLLAFSTLYDVVGALAPLKCDRERYAVHRLEAIPNDFALVGVRGMGLAFVVMTREVVEAVVKTKLLMTDPNTGRELHSVFRTDIHQGAFRGEDIAFCADLEALGYQAWIDPAVDVAHHGTKRYTGCVAKAIYCGPPEATEGAQSWQQPQLT